MKLATLIEPLDLDYINPDFTDEHFPYEDKGQGDVMLFHTKDKYLSAEEVLKRMNIKGLRPATLHEMLAWAKDNWKDEFVVVALGSVWTDRDGDRHVACLDQDGSLRDLDLSWCDDDWNEFCRFAAVKVPRK